MRAMVTGGGGFLGRRIVELLLEEGHEVRFLARSAYPDIEALGARGLQVDLRDREALRGALAGCDTVFHVASKAGYWGDPAEFEAINVHGTENLLAACREQGVARFVYTSTPSVVGYGIEADGIDSAPYPNTWESPYGETKARAERLVLAANGPDLATVALRPHLIIGERDPHLVPRVIERARLGRLFAVGDRTNRVDLTYVDNAAWAHLDAAHALTDAQAPCAGKAYFISNDAPVVLWDWIDDFLGRVGAPPVRRRVPLGLALGAGTLVEGAWRALRLSGEPPLTRFLALALARSHWYDMGPARRELGYRIRVPLDEATERTARWFSAQKAN